MEINLIWRTFPTNFWNNWHKHRTHFATIHFKRKLKEELDITCENNDIKCFGIFVGTRKELILWINEFIALRKQIKIDKWNFSVIENKTSKSFENPQISTWI